MKPLTLGVGALCIALLAKPIVAQDSVTVTAGARYQAGGFRRFVLGATYRDLWATPIRVPLLDLRRFAGGLTPTKVGGGNQTKSLRFVAPQGSEYVFRLVDKDKVPVPPGFEGTLIEWIARDQISANHPAAAVVAVPLLEAAGLLHVATRLAVMPDDSLLGKFRAEFAGKLGMIEAFPSKQDDAPGFAGAIEIIDSEELRALLEKDPRERIDARAYLTARLMDGFLNDWDRHPGNWKWARMRSGPALWVPIGRDRDKVFISFGGIVGAAGKFSHKLTKFRGSYPSVDGLIGNGLELDRRLLGGLEKPVWDSVAAELRHKLTDQLIDAAVLTMPAEYRSSAPGLAATLKQRRDTWAELATAEYLLLAAAPDIHATDAADQATVLRRDDGSVEVQIRSGNDAPWFHRRFLPSETDEIRLYLHGGDDRAVVKGDVTRSMRVRIIGGNGNNVLIDSSRVAGRPGQARLYNPGTVTDVSYGPDSVFNRRPWIRSDGHLVPPGRDRGSKIGPVLGFSAPGDLGLVVRLGVSQTRYGFRLYPDAGRTMLTAEYATGVSGWRFTGWADRRHEGSRLHYTARARMSELEVINFQGLGNATAPGPSSFFRVQQRQWRLEPTVAFALGSRSDISLGPVFQYSTTDNASNSYLATSHPYGSGGFGEAGLRLGLVYDVRDQAEDSRNGIRFDLAATAYPKVWDVDKAFGVLSAGTAVHYAIPVPLHPILVLRVNAKKLLGEFPFHESAFIGGGGSVRMLELQRYAGDASLGGTTELRLPFGRVPLILPLDLGIYGFADAGRVFVKGASPGGWHTGTGVGLWIGILSPATALNVELGAAEGRTRIRIKTGLDF